MKDRDGSQTSRVAKVVERLHLDADCVCFPDCRPGRFAVQVRRLPYPGRKGA
jgi:hypothetical protein